MAKGKKFWTYLEDMEGDKVVWIIVILLILCSVLCLFSSTSHLLTKGQTRLDIVREQIVLSFVGIGILIAAYNIKKVEFWRGLAKIGFIGSLALLLLLVSGLDLGILRPVTINGARRIIQVSIGGHGIQLHVFEIVKVAMVMYLAWAMDALKKGELDKYLPSENARKWAFIYGPFAITVLLLITGSGSAAIFMGGIMFLVIMLGGGSIREFLMILATGAVLIGVVAGLNHVSRSEENPRGRIFQRWATIENRIFNGDHEDYEQTVLHARKGSLEYQEALDKIRQPYSAKIAVHQGGLWGKGPGRSEQRYVVPDMSEDYMYSFIIEEYGLLGGMFVLILYLSLLARSSIIVRGCNDLFAKLCVAGLSLLIVGQAFLHIFVNVDFGPMTGQTLPIISHGASAFICFIIAFGVILSLSRISAKEMKKMQREAQPLVELEQVQQEQQSGLEDLEDFESEKIYDQEV
ncbi:MAG: FtsW/RodA/SpoVE family cell cycle protein [Bacteroidales bacterium]|nr:FtsW/RodA/SpoVE family cell cycle protein [Bacteroidales bacterium]